jgi:iron complex transport system ATP-binding protein
VSEGSLVPGADGGLVLEDVTAGFGDRWVLQAVSLEARPGEVVGLIGPNGSGKTTLVRVASRGLAPRSGRVLVEGHDPYRLTSRQAARLAAVVPQDVVPAFAFTVLEVVLMGRAPYLSPWSSGRPEDWARARRAMAQANVQHLADRPLEELSGGERQRVVLAQALAQDAPVLLLDEPTTHLDLRHVIDILSLVWSLARREDRAVLAIFHDLNLAAAYCDRIYALNEGMIVASGSAREVITTTLLREVFEVDAEAVPSRTSGLPTIVLPPPPPGVRPGPVRAHVIGGAGTGAPAIRLLAQAGFEVTTGVLHSGDTDDEVAQRLNILRVSVPPFSPIDQGAVDECVRFIQEADLVVVCDPPFGPGNVENLRLALRAVELKRPVIVLDRIPMAERDFTGGVATALWDELKEGARVVTSDRMLAVQARAVAGSVGIP